MSCFEKWELIPFGVTSSELIECFIICGYEPLLINENISDYIIKNESNIKENELNEFNFYTLPKIYNIISSSFTREMVPLDKIIYYIFPLPIKICFKKESLENNFEPDNKFYFIQNGSTNVDKLMYNVFCYVFYEEIMILDNKYKVFNPKIFMIISQYTLYHLFRKILIDIRNLFYLKNIEIPIEIQIYNILNFIPAPIHSNLNYILFPNYTLEEYIIKNEEEFLKLPNNKIYNSNQLRMYPFYDCNLCEIFKLLPYDILAQIYLFIFYEIQIYFFSKDLEKLNIMMSVLISLFYQFDTQYNWQIFSVGENEIKNADESEILGKPFSNMTGINTSYSEAYARELINPPFICFDYENKEFYYFKKKDDEKEKAVINYIKNVISTQKINGILDKNIINLIERLKHLSNKLGYNNKNEEKIEFFSDNISNNKDLLNIFYDFFANILAISNYGFSVEQLENPQKGEYYIIKFDKKFDNYPNKGSNKEENDFFQNFLDFKMDTFSQYITGISKPVKSLFCNYKIAEYFMTFKKIINSNNYDIEIDYMDLMDKLYGENNYINIHFYNFFIYYKEKLQKFFGNYINSDNIIKIIKDNKIIYKYKNIELDKSILLIYSQILNQLEEIEITNIFPSKKILNLPYYIEIEKNKFQNILDNYIFENKLISSKELLIICFLIFFTITIEKNQIINLKTTILGNLWSLNFVTKYIYRMLFVYYNICEIQIKKEDYSILYMKDSYLDIFNVLKSKGILSNGEILNLVNKIYNLYEHEKEKLKSYKIENNKIDTFYNNIKNKDNLFTCDLEENNVKIEDNKIKEEIDKFCENQDNLTYFGLIKENCKIHFKTTEINNNNDLICGIYSYYKLFKSIDELYKNFIQTFDLKSLDQNIYKEIIVNLIFYFSNSQIKNKVILKFLLLCLYDD